MYVLTISAYISARAEDEISKELFPRESSSRCLHGEYKIYKSLEFVLTSAPTELFSLIKSQRGTRILVTSQY